MRQIIVTEGAAKGLERCRKFLGEKSRAAARRAGDAIWKQFAVLVETPEIGRPLADAPELRELLITFGDSGYVALYRYDPETETIYVLAFRHQREAGH